MVADPRVIHDGERIVLDILRRHRQPGSMVVFDVGANIGDYIHEVLRRIPFVVIVAFEPQPEAVHEIARRFPKRLTIENCAIGKRDGVIEMARDQPKSYHASVYRTQHSVLGLFSDRLSVKQYRIDTYCALHMVRKIDLMKIDVEGAEMDVLEGAGNLVNNGQIKLIQFEYNDNAELAGVQFVDFWTFFRGRDYKLFREYDRRLAPLSRYDKDMEEPIHPGRNYLAVHASVDWWPD